MYATIGRVSVRAPVSAGYENNGSTKSVRVQQPSFKTGARLTARTSRGLVAKRNARLVIRAEDMSESTTTETEPTTAAEPVPEPVAEPVEEEGMFGMKLPSLSMPSFPSFGSGESKPKTPAKKVTPSEKAEKKAAQVAWKKEYQAKKKEENYRTADQRAAELAEAKAAKAAAREEAIAKATMSRDNPTERSIQDKSSVSFQLISIIAVLAFTYGFIAILYGPKVLGL